MKGKGGLAHLQVLLEFHLQRGGRTKFWPATHQEQVVCPVYGLGKSGQGFMQFPRKRWRAAARWNKNQLPIFDKLAALLDVKEGHLRQPYVDVTGNYQDRGVKAGFVVTAPKELRERFPCLLYPPCMEMNKCG